jgi:hypothetical protein
MGCYVGPVTHPESGLDPHCVIGGTNYQGTLYSIFLLGGMGAVITVPAILALTIFWIVSEIRSAMNSGRSPETEPPSIPEQ